MRRLKVVMADDHRLMLDAIRAVLEGDDSVEIVGETQSGAAVVPLVRKTDPDAILLDLRMPEVDGLENLTRLHRSNPGLVVIVLSGSDDRELIREALHRGAKAFVNKQIDPRDLGAVIRQNVEGTVHQSFGPLREESHAAEAGLSSSQIRVLEELVHGLSNKEIAQTLWLSEQTVKFHLSNIYRLLGVKSRAEAIRHAYERRLVAPPLHQVA
jgi:DNA-binding NarL/FixJ family response regulator